MCNWGTDKIIYVIRRNNNLTSDGWHPVAVDFCIADEVQQMNNRGIITTGCCCGHGKRPPEVLVSLESKELLDKFGYLYEIYEDRTLLVNLKK
jgi:hypothetical protein